MIFLGIDLGSSSVKVSFFDGEKGRSLASTHYPKTELEIQSPHIGWAEQDPQVWWQSIVHACRELIDSSAINPIDIQAIGIAYQMHGLVLVDENQEVLRPSIIWCDSRAIECGEEMETISGSEYCFSSLLNSPGNFTAAKLRWVQKNEPELFAKVRHIMLPGDYVAMRMSGEVRTSASGLSEGTLWDFKSNEVANKLLRDVDINSELIPELVPTFGDQGVLSDSAAKELGLNPGTAITYRAGDQPNNALSLNVLNPGECAATAGTSGVIYGVSDTLVSDPQSRVNSFLHVNSNEAKPRVGVLACVNGTGRLYSWLRQILSNGGKQMDYAELNSLAEAVDIGSDGLWIHPFGNGAERIFSNRDLGAQFGNIDFNRHGIGHLIRAAQEGIVFALNEGFEVLKSLGADCKHVRVGYGNMFLSEIFTQTFVNTTQTTLEFYETDGAEGAARGAALGAGYYKSEQEAFSHLKCISRVEPSAEHSDRYLQAYQAWAEALQARLN